MTYELTFRPGVPRDLKRLDAQVRKRVDKAIMSLVSNPRPSGSRKVVGSARTWRIRVGDWRVVYEIDDARQILEVQIVAHRREVYRDY